MKSITEAFERLNIIVPDFTVTFGKLKAYNANVTKTPFSWHFKLSKEWKTVDDEITIGLIQSLIAKFYKLKKSTMNMELYENFVRNLHISIPKSSSDPMLDESFQRVNEKYFYGMIEKPNFKWGSESKRTLGTYDYKRDLIKISTLFKQAESELLDYIVYHELLHKKHKFYSKSGRSYHHTHQFRTDEKAFSDANMELKLKRFLVSVKARRKAEQVTMGFFEKIFRKF